MHAILASHALGHVHRRKAIAEHLHHARAVWKNSLQRCHQGNSQAHSTRHCECYSHSHGAQSQAVQDLNEEVLGLAGITSLLDFVPEESEKSQIDAYLNSGGDMKELGKAEKYILAISEVRANLRSESAAVPKRAYWLF